MQGRAEQGRERRTEQSKAEQGRASYTAIAGPFRADGRVYYYYAMAWAPALAHARDGLRHPRRFFRSPFWLTNAYYCITARPPLVRHSCARRSQTTRCSPAIWSFRGGRRHRAARHSKQTTHRKSRRQRASSCPRTPLITDAAPPSCPRCHSPWPSP